MHIISAKAAGGAPSDERDGVLRLADGRTLTYALLGAGPEAGDGGAQRAAGPEAGDGGAPLVVVLDGPGSRGLARAAAPAASALGIRLVAPDRPGAGGSTAAPGRTIADWAEDHAALLDALGAERAGVLAQSGGTPFALAVGAALAARTSGLAFMGAVAPLDDPAAFAETGRQLRTALTLARRAPWLLRLGLRASARGARRDPERAARRFAKGLPAADAKALADPALWALHVRATAEVLARPDGFADEVRLLAAPWGVDPAQITVPAAFWSGDGDTIHPTSHSRRLAAQLHGAAVTVVPDTATFGLLPHYPDALRFAVGEKSPGL